MKRTAGAPDGRNERVLKMNQWEGGNWLTAADSLSFRSSASSLDEDSF